MVGLKRGTVQIEPYNSQWIETFEDEERLLKDVFNPNTPIYHIGSTSVPGLSAKPIIDIALVQNFNENKYEEKRKEIGTKLRPYGYSFRQNGSSSTKLFFAKGPEDKRTVYLHIYGSLENLDLIEAIAFRNILRRDKEYRQKYQNLKIELAQKWGNERGKYTEAKAGLIRELTNLGLDQGAHDET